MKRISALLCAMILTICMTAPACFAAKTDAAATDAAQVTEPGFELVNFELTGTSVFTASA